ncbi:VanZ family protein [Pareuzebyella sediminis]|uniref:VanZ family protein n=1 Tax=Pareuzebyella sediminis TaxID=2607998 RepID=UPI0011EEB32C|nr:VanZ family protein [Pareuzebyella sediminis]
MLKKRKFTIAFLGWMVFITFSCLYSFNEAGVSTLVIPHADKLVHFTFYLVATVLAILFVREMTNGHFPLVKTLWITLIGAIIYGIIIEVLQYALPVDRDADVFDALANSAGAIMGSILAKSIFSNKRGLKWSN